MSQRRILSAVSVAFFLTAAHVRAASVTLTAARDTSLFETNPDSNSCSFRLASGTTNNGLRSRAIFAFSLSGQIPSGATIDSVVLSLNIIRQSTSAQSSAYGVHRLLADWGEGSGNIDTAPAQPGDATWNSRLSGSNLWTAPGVQAGTDYASALSGAGPVVNLGSGTYTINSTAALVADVQAWLDAPASNFGWILISQSEGISATARRFDASEATIDGSTGPRISVNFTVLPEPRIWFFIIIGLGILSGVRQRRVEHTGLGVG